MVYPADEETFDERVSPGFVRDDHLNLIQAFLKRLQDFVGYGGRLHDETGLVMPVGAIIPYGGDTAPSGWLLCDGKSYLRAGADYVDLFAVIGTKYGTPAGSLFNVPDSRGVFLRGCSKIASSSFIPDDVVIGDDQIIDVGNEFYRAGIPIRFTTDGTLPAPFLINTTYYIISEGSAWLSFATTRANAIANTAINITTVGVGTSYINPYIEEDKDSRLKLATGGNDGEDLGSYQEDALQGHYHKIIGASAQYPHWGYREASGSDPTNYPNGSWGTDRYNAKDIWDDPSYGVAKVAVETRPRNVYVNYIIKR